MSEIKKKIAAAVAAAMLITAFMWNLSVERPVASAAETGSDVQINWPVKISEETFPDAAFRQYVLKNADRDGNGELSQSEADRVTEIRIYNNKAVTSLEGIGYFSKLESLYCDSDSITALDISNNTALVTLNCSSNEISTLDLTKNINLENLECFNNKLTSLDVSGNPKLVNLLCGGSNIEKIDLSNNINLKSFAYLAGGLTEVDFSNNPELEQIWISGVPLENLDVSHNQKLTSLLVNTTNIRTLDLSANPLLQAENVNLIANRLIALHTNMPDAEKINVSNQRPVTVAIPPGGFNYDLRKLDPDIHDYDINDAAGAEIKDGVVINAEPGMEISYHYVENGEDLIAHIRFEKADVTDPTEPEEPQQPAEPDNPSGQIDSETQNNTQDTTADTAITKSTDSTAEEAAYKMADKAVNTSDESHTVAIMVIVLLSASGAVIALATGRRAK